MDWSWDDMLSGLAGLGGLASLGGMGFGVAEGIRQQGILEQIRKEQQHATAESAAMANRQAAAATAPPTPVDWRQFYTPMSDAEKAMFINQMKADFATRGVPLDSAVVSEAVARQLAMTEQQRVQQAQAMAQNQMGINQGQQQIAVGGLGGATRGLIGSTAPYPQFAPMPNFGSAFGPMMAMWAMRRGQQQPPQPRVAAAPSPYDPYSAADFAQPGAAVTGPNTAPWSGYDFGTTNVSGPGYAPPMALRDIPTSASWSEY